MIQSIAKRRVRTFVFFEAGTSLVEFALVAPVLIALLVGLIDVGRYMYFGILSEHAARAAVQYGSQNLRTASDSAGMVAAAMADGQNLSNWTQTTGGITAIHTCSVSGAPATTCASGAPTAGTVYYVSVTVNGTFKALFNYPGIPNNVPISATATMRVADQ